MLSYPNEVEIETGLQLGFEAALPFISELESRCGVEYALDEISRSLEMEVERLRHSIHESGSLAPSSPARAARGARFDF